MVVIFDGSMSGLSILATDSAVKIIDNDLNVYDTWDMDDAFVSITDIPKRFVDATLKYYKDLKYKQFMTLSLKSFARYFKKEYLEYQKQQLCSTFGVRRRLIKRQIKELSKQLKEGK